MSYTEDITVGAIIRSKEPYEVLRIADVEEGYGERIIHYDTVWPTDISKRSQQNLRDFLSRTWETIPQHTDPAIFEAGKYYRAVTMRHVFKVISKVGDEMIIQYTFEEYPTKVYLWEFCSKVYELDSYHNS